MYKYVKYTIDDDKDNAEKVVKVTIENSEIQKSVEKATTTIQSTAKVKGFRPGHVPKEVAVNAFQHEILEESTKDLFNDLLNQIVKNEKLTPIATTQVNEENGEQEGQVILIFKIPIYFPIEIPELHDIKVEKEKIEVTDTEIEEGIKRIWTNYKKDTTEEVAFTEEIFKEMNIPDVTNLEELREWVKKSILSLKSNQVKSKFAEEFLSKAISKTKVVIHEQIVAEELNKRENDLRKLAEKDKSDFTELLKSHDMTVGSYREKVKEQILKSGQSEIFLRELANKWNVEVSEEEVNEELKRAQQLVSQYGSLDYVKDLIKDSILRTKAYEMIIDKYFEEAKPAKE